MFLHLGWQGGEVCSLRPGDQPLPRAGAGVPVQPLLPLIGKGTSHRAKRMIN